MNDIGKKLAIGGVVTIMGLYGSLISMPSCAYAETIWPPGTFHHPENPISDGIDDILNSPSGIYQNVSKLIKSNEKLWNTENKAFDDFNPGPL